MLYVSFIVTTKQKPTVDTQKIEENQSIPLLTIINSQRKTVNQEDRNYKASRKQ